MRPCNNRQFFEVVGFGFAVKTRHTRFQRVMITSMLHSRNHGYCIPYDAVTFPLTYQIHLSYTSTFKI